MVSFLINLDGGNIMKNPDRLKIGTRILFNEWDGNVTKATVVDVDPNNDDIIVIRYADGERMYTTCSDIDILAAADLKIVDVNLGVIPETFTGSLPIITVKMENGAEVVIGDYLPDEEWLNPSMFIGKTIGQSFEARYSNY